MNFTSVLLEELIRAWEDYGKNLREEIKVRNWLTDFLPSLELGTWPVPFTPWGVRAWNALGALPTFLVAGLGAGLARVVLPSVSRQKKLHQKVIPLDRVAETLGPNFVRDLLRFDKATAPKEIKRPLDTLRKVIAGTFELPTFLKNKFFNVAVGWLTAAINALMLIGAVIASAAICEELIERQNELVDGALGQSASRKRVRVVGGGTILRRMPGGSRP